MEIETKKPCNPASGIQNNSFTIAGGFGRINGRGLRKTKKIKIRIRIKQGKVRYPYPWFFHESDI
jgi:hypothetical protein